MNLTMKISEAAELLRVSPQTLRVGLQQNKFTFGTAIKTSSHYTYHISTAKLYEYLGLDYREVE